MNILSSPESRARRLPEPRVAPPDITVDNPSIQAYQKKLASLTIALPMLGTVIAFISLVWLPFTWMDGILMVVMYVATILGVTVGFHRQFAHRSFKAKPGLRVALGILGSMAAQGNLIYWVATHRRHHQYSEGDGDPHSPYLFEGKKLGFLQGLWHSHLGWMLDSQMTNTVKFTKDLMRDPAIAWVNKRYFWWVGLGLVIPAVLGGLFTLSWQGAVGGFLWGGVVRMCLVQNAMWTSGSTAHMFGTRPFATRDMSTNNGVLAVANLGEGWHNNHHAFPSSAQFGLYWWQIDIGGLFIMLFQAVGLASDVRKPTRDMVKAKRSEVLPHGPVEGESW